MAPKPTTATSTSRRHLSCGPSPSGSIQPDPQSSDVSRSLQEKRSTSFEQFNIVSSFSDHHFAKSAEMQRPNTWMKKIQQEWKILEKNLPETIFVRVCESKMDLLRAAIIGPSGTPYHDGLFFFDFMFTANYPNEPPKAYYHSGGLRLNPNLYANGTVCLSLLNTWLGRGCERWDPHRSTMLQILVSIQGLVLNAKPYFNEPINSWKSSTSRGEKSSLQYNESAFLLSCRTMTYTLRKPPEHFEELVTSHFHEHGLCILMACRDYLNGTHVSCVVAGSRQKKSMSMKGCSEDFKNKLKPLTDELVKAFTTRGIDCQEFLTKSKQDADSKLLASKRAEAGNTSATGGQANPHKKSSSKLKRFGQYLLKLGKKVLPIDN